jgi:predicted nicotinamide N-methyase
MEKLLDSEVVGDRFSASAYMPYWASIWPVSRAMAAKILSHKWPKACSVLELGCGLGLAGVAALKAGHDVTFSDYDASALDYAKRNAELNGFTSAKFLEMNWKHPRPNQFDLIIGADLTWDLELVPHLIRVFETMLKPQGVIWLADQNRLDQSDFLRRLYEIGMTASISVLELDPAWGWDIAGSFYQIERSIQI